MKPDQTRIVVFCHPYSGGHWFTLTDRRWHDPQDLSPRNPVDNFLFYEEVRTTRYREHCAPRLPPNPWRSLSRESGIYKRLDIAGWLPKYPREFVDLPLVEIFVLDEGDPRTRMPPPNLPEKDLVVQYLEELARLKLAMIPAQLPPDEKLLEKFSTSRLAGIRAIVRDFSLQMVKRTSHPIEARRSLWALLDSLRVINLWVEGKEIPW